MDDRRIELLASSDFPTEENIRAHRLAIVEIIRSGNVPSDLEWEPSEVCGLSSWNPDKYEREDDHVWNIWSSCVLLIAGSHAECTGRNCVGMGLGDKAASLLYSASNRVVLADIDDFFRWLTSQMEYLVDVRCESEPASFAWLGRLILSVLRGESADAINQIAGGMAERVERESALEFMCRNDTKRWRRRYLFQLTNFDQHHHLWECMAKDALKTCAERPDAALLLPAIEVLQRIVDRP